MKTEDFESIVEGQIQTCRDVLIVKAKEYATQDRLHNFKVAAELQGVTLREALAGMMAKHTVSVYDMCKPGPANDAAVWDEKITDHINYLLLLRAVIAEEHRGDFLRANPKHMTPEMVVQTEAAFLENIKSKKHDPYLDNTN